jgi:hypothetical protein
VGRSSPFSPSFRSCCGFIGLSTILTWVYNKTAGSLLITVLLYATVNFFAAILTVLLEDTLASAHPFLLYTFLVCLLATSVMLFTGPRLSSKHVLGQSRLNNNPRE